MALPLRCTSCGARFAVAEGGPAPRMCPFCGERDFENERAAERERVIPEHRAPWREGPPTPVPDRFEIQRSRGARAIAAGLLVLVGLCLPRPVGGGGVLAPFHALLTGEGDVVLRIVTALAGLAGLMVIVAGFAVAWRGRGVLYILLGIAPFVTRWALAGEPGLPLPVLVLIAGFSVYVASLWTAAQLPRNQASQRAHLSGGTAMLVGLGLAIALTDPDGKAHLLAPGLAIPLCFAVAAVVVSFVGSCSDVLSYRLGWVTRFLCYVAAFLFLAGRIFRSGGGDPFYEAVTALPWAALVALTAIGFSDTRLDFVSAAAHARDRENFGQLLGYLERYNPDARFGSKRDSGTRERVSVGEGPDRERNPFTDRR